MDIREIDLEVNQERLIDLLETNTDSLEVGILPYQKSFFLLQLMKMENT
ncbi:hypothetical protein [Listeria valentina]|nr:hypothetical protein [Listeria valentina]